MTRIRCQAQVTSKRSHGSRLCKNGARYIALGQCLCGIHAKSNDRLSLTEEDLQYIISNTPKDAKIKSKSK